MEKLAKECYAYPEMDMYPIHTKQAAAQSIELFQTQKQNFMPAIRAKIAAKLATAADFHEIGTTKVAAALPDVVNMPVGDASVSFGIPATIEQAQQLAMHLTKLASLGTALRDTRDASRVGIMLISDSADKNNWSDDIFMGSQVRNLMKMAGLGIGDKEIVADQFRKRATLVAFSPRQRRQLFQLANQVQNMPDQIFMKKASLDTLCDTLQSIDTQYALKNHYGYAIQDPKQACYAETVFQLHKKAADRLYIPSTDTILSKSALYEEKQAATAYFKHFHGCDITTDEQLISKVAALDESQVSHFIGYVQGYTEK